jgi:hypothetical protein
MPEQLYGRNLLLEDVTAARVLGDVTSQHHEITFEQPAMLGFREDAGARRSAVDPCQCCAIQNALLPTVKRIDNLDRKRMRR